MATFRRFSYSNTEKDSSYPVAWGAYRLGHRFICNTYRPAKRYSIGYAVVARKHPFVYKQGAIHKRYKFKHIQALWEYRFRYKSGRILGCYRFKYNFFGEIHLEKPIIDFMHPLTEIFEPIMMIDFMYPAREVFAESYTQVLLSVIKDVLVGADGILAEHAYGKITAEQVSCLLEAFTRNVFASNGDCTVEASIRAISAYNQNILENPEKEVSHYISDTRAQRNDGIEVFNIADIAADTSPKNLLRHNDVFMWTLRERRIAIERILKGLVRGFWESEIAADVETVVGSQRACETADLVDNITAARAEKSANVIIGLAMLLRESIKKAETERIKLLSRFESEIHNDIDSIKLSKTAKESLNESSFIVADKEPPDGCADTKGLIMRSQIKEAIAYIDTDFCLNVLKEIFEAGDILTEKHVERDTDFPRSDEKLDKKTIKECCFNAVFNCLERLAVKYIILRESLKQLDKSVIKDIVFKTLESLLWREIAGDVGEDYKGTWFEIADDELKEILIESIIAKLERDSLGMGIEKPGIIVDVERISEVLTEAIEQLADAEKLIITEMMTDLLNKGGRLGFVGTAQALSVVHKELFEIPLIHAAKLNIDIDFENEHELDLWQRFWFLYAGSITDKVILPCHDYPYEAEPITFEGFDDLMPENRQVTYPETFWKGVGHHPVQEGKGIGLKEIPLAINIMIDIVNILILMWCRFYPAFWGWTGTQAVLGITTEIYRWLTLETSKAAQDEKGSREHYGRCFRWLRWEAEKVSLLARNDMELRGNYYVGILLEEMINYMLDHHFDIMPIFVDVNKMDEWRRSFEKDLQHDITWVLDKVKGIRHKLIEGRSKKHNV